MGVSAQPRKYRRYAFSKAEDNGWKCHYCGVRLGPGTLTGDHIKAQSKGGRDKYSNIVPACEDCNSRKSDLAVEVWLSGRPRRKDRRSKKHPPISVLNPRTGEWVPIGAQGRCKIETLAATGKYTFR